MPIQIKHARKGYKFVLSAYGLEKNSVRKHFVSDEYEKYKYKVPCRWFTNGLVREVKDDVC